jgi:hypothetical protein
MGIKDNNPEFWYQKDDGSWDSWGELANLTSISVEFSAELNDEDTAKLSRIIVPLGELEIVPREK